MTVGSATGNHGTSMEEQDALDRSKKKVKTTESMENPEAVPTETDVVRTVEEIVDQNGTIGETGKDKSMHRSFKQALLRSRFNETETERSFDCEAAYLSSDEEMENEKDTEEAMVGEGNTLHPAEEDSTALWVRFPNLPIEYYDEKVLYQISKVLGTPLKIDINTAMTARGKYARVCVEMDLRKPLISHLTIGRYHYVVEYEHLHTLCFSCGRVGHRKDKCPEYPVMSSEKMKPNVTVNTPGLDSGPGSSRPTDNKNKEVCTEEEKSGYGPWTIAPSRRKFQQHKHKSKAQQYKGNRFEVLNSTTVHGESSGAQEHYTDLDLGHNIATNSISYGPKQGPLPTTVQSSPGMDVDQTQLVQNMGPVLGPASGMEIGHGPNETGEKQQNMQSTIHNESLTISPDGTIIQTNPNSLTQITSSPAVHTASGSAISAGDTPPVHRSKARGGKALSHSEAQEVKGHGRNRREHRDDRASRESVPDAAVYGARERSLSPYRNRMVGRRSEATDSTMVGDRFAQCETHGVSETSVHYGDRSEESEKHLGAA
ncbi:hypothetical protein LOK49_LG11G01583 [Camellia lanceoleosa]|uniref:Uncharacterized protein n=1 Tax=Camellia lanceoleosa TaxID=1840588 RepID=A0ACC0FY97_9ERIC|nr:hypothetical protein LOK49_LG11G01583 [Camellia lanceoleosa]